MMFGLGRLHFIKKEDKLCAKLSALFILSGLQRASRDSGKQCSVSIGGHNTSVTGPDALFTFSLLYCMSSTWVPKSLPVSTAMMDYYKD